MRYPTDNGDSWVNDGPGGRGDEEICIDDEYNEYLCP